MIESPACPECGGPLERQFNRFVCACGYERGGGPYRVFHPDTPPEVIAATIAADMAAIDASGEPETELLDRAGGVPDDGQERNWDGQTRAEYLDMLEENHTSRNVLVDDVWRVEEEAIDELGADEVARLRAEMRQCLDTEWAELKKKHP